MTAEPDPPPSPPEQPEQPEADQTSAADQPEQPGDQSEQPRLSVVAERFRIPLGVLASLLGVALAVTFAVQPLGVAGGTRGVIEHVAAVAIWVMVAAVGVSWAARAPRKVTNMLALGGIAAYVVMLVAGL